MTVAPIQCNTLGGLGNEMILKGWHALAFNKSVRQALQSAIKASNNHGGKSTRVYCRSLTPLARLPRQFHVVANVYPCDSG